ncbi:hypothetical protein Z517_11847 [Fonsecaea pedrosoi CBS 271.37]|uniref:BTB domain-containing protein n=1 Tax=Fonsecaea pedrosoi CBS 271.37 TaxID=1442368 RepID=A0A0D2DBV8_9EURO|nr:uncharacterized protein Z517_11847 [Fonsecaea pedrosoi CBS 271.37]KIW75076.1 hypothetical protein Z517_11847 [Fonsecaea pedrosoi CBS 271.37]
MSRTNESHEQIPEPNSAILGRGFVDSPLVTLTAGEEKFFVHRHILVAKCPFFARQLESGPLRPPLQKEEEGENKPVTEELEFPHDSRDMIGHFLAYIYTGRVDFSQSDDAVLAILKSWVLAGELSMPDWKSQLVDHVIAHWAD